MWHLLSVSLLDALRSQSLSNNAKSVHTQGSRLGFMVPQKKRARIFSMHGLRTRRPVHLPISQQPSTMLFHRQDAVENPPWQVLYRASGKRSGCFDSLCGSHEQQNVARTSCCQTCKKEKKNWKQCSITSLPAQNVLRGLGS